MIRFVRPDEITLVLPHGDTITIHRELTYRERIEGYETAYVKEPDGSYRRNPLLTAMAFVTSYLIDWSAQPPIKGLSRDALADTLNALSFESFIEIKDAIEAHEAQSAREQQRPEAVPPSDPPSPSLVGAGGGTNGSATSR